MTYNEYVETVRTFFKQCSALTDEVVAGYFAQEETIRFLKEGYEHFTGNCPEFVRAGYTPQAVASTLDLLY